MQSQEGRAGEMSPRDANNGAGGVGFDVLEDDTGR